MSEIKIELIGLDEIKSNLQEIKNEFLQLTSIVEDFANFSTASEGINTTSEAVKGLSASFGLVSTSIVAFTNIMKLSTTAMEIYNAVQENRAQMDLFLRDSLSACGVAATAASGGVNSLSSSISFLSAGITQVAATTGLMLASFLVFSQWDEMSDTMRAFAVALGIASLSVLAFQVAAASATPAVIAFLAPILNIVAIVGAVVAGLALIAGAFEALTETDYEKQLKAETEAIEKETEAIKEQAEAYNDLIEKRKESGYEILAQSQMYKDMSDELSALSEVENQSAEQKERMQYLTEELNNSLGTEISLREKDGKLIVEGNENIDEYIQKLQNQAMAEVVAAEYKKAYTEAFSNANELNKLLAEEEVLTAKLSSEGLTSAEWEKLNAIREGITERKALQEEFNTDIVELENIQYQASIGNTQAMTDAFMLNTEMRNEAAQEEAYNREEIQNMMYETLSEQEKEALTEALLRIQENGGNIDAYLDENGKLRKDINLSYLQQMNSDISEEGSIAANNSQESGRNVALGYGSGINEGKPEAEGAVTGLAADTISAGNDTFEINSPSKVFERMGRYVVEGLNAGISEMAPETEEGMSNITRKVSGAFNGVKLPRLKGRFHDDSVGNALRKVAELFGFSTTPRLTIQKLAVGGFVEPGEFFLAREAGPELVGTIGGKTAVMNNNQIVDAVSNGVYRAVTQAMGSGNGGNYTFNITNTLDGTAIGKQVIKYHNGVVKQTGVSPLHI